MSMDLMPYFSSYLFSTKKLFHSTSKSTKVEVATKVKVIYVNNKRWGGRMFCAFPVMRVFQGRAFFVSLSVPPI